MSSQNNSRALFERAKVNDAPAALLMLDDRVNLRIDVNATFDNGCTCAFFAAYHGNVELMTRLIAAGADPNRPEDNGVTPLGIACVQGRIHMVDYLLANVSNLDPNTIVAGLCTSCQYGYPQIIRRLLGRGIDVNLALDDEGATALYVATESMKEEVVILLLSMGANPNITRDTYAPLHIATQLRAHSIIERLLKAGARPNVQARDGATPLLIAAQNGDIKSIDILARHKASPNIAMTTDGSTPLYVACARQHTNSALALMDIEGINVDLTMKDGSSVLHLLCQYGNMKVILELFERFPSTKFDEPRVDGPTPLLIAARHGQFEICQLLIDKGANIHAKCDGETPLAVATRYGRSDTIRVLTEAEAKSSQPS
eukprot:gene16089-19145_t